MYIDTCWIPYRHTTESSIPDLLCCKPVPSHLPRPLRAGDVVGVDLKPMIPPRGPRWCLLLLVDFTSNRLWAWDLGEDKTLVRIGELEAFFFEVSCVTPSTDFKIAKLPRNDSAISMNHFSYPLQESILHSVYSYSKSKGKKPFPMWSTGDV